MEKIFITPLNFSAYRDYLCPKKSSLCHINQKNIKFSCNQFLTAPPLNQPFRYMVSPRQLKHLITAHRNYLCTLLLQTSALCLADEGSAHMETFTRGVTMQAKIMNFCLQFHRHKLLYNSTCPILSNLSQEIILSKMLCSILVSSSNKQQACP